MAGNFHSSGSKTYNGECKEHMVRILILQVERISAHSCAQDIHASNETLYFRRAETNNIMLDITPIFLRSYVVFPATTGNLNLTGKQKYFSPS